MATSHQIRDLITETTTGTLRPRVPREVRDEVCRYAARRRKQGAPWAVIARETVLPYAPTTQALGIERFRGLRDFRAPQA